MNNFALHLKRNILYMFLCKYYGLWLVCCWFVGTFILLAHFLYRVSAILYVADGVAFGNVYSSMFIHYYLGFLFFRPPLTEIF